MMAVSMFKLEVFVLEFGSVDRFATGAVVICKVSPLTHKARDNPVEGAAFVPKSMVSSAKGSEIFCSFGDHVFS